METRMVSYSNGHLISNSISSSLIISMKLYLLFLEHIILTSELVHTTLNFSLIECAP